MPLKVQPVVQVSSRGDRGLIAKGRRLNELPGPGKQQRQMRLGKYGTPVEEIHHVKAYLIVARWLLNAQLK